MHLQIGAFVSFRSAHRLTKPMYPRAAAPSNNTRAMIIECQFWLDPRKKSVESFNQAPVFFTRVPETGFMPVGLQRRFSADENSPMYNSTRNGGDVSSLYSYQVVVHFCLRVKGSLL